MQGNHGKAIHPRPQPVARGSYSQPDLRKRQYMTPHTDAMTASASG